jgi:heterodisulfide reductase subunit B2
MRIGFYPGCSLQGTGNEYRESLFAVTQKCGIELEEIKDWNCCGASAAHSLNHELSVALPARTLALAEEQGMSEIVVPCAACYSRLATAQRELKENKALQEKVTAQIEKPRNHTIRILTMLDFLQEYIFPVAEQHVTRKLNQKTACYYGCLLTRPKENAHIERIEDPMDMETVLRKIGATPIDWAFKCECCGAGLSVSRTDIVAKLSGKVLEDAADRGAESIIVACPMCQLNLDLRRREINQQLNRKIDLPVLFITQALGLSMGIPANKLGLNKHFVSTGKVLSCIQNIER